MKPTDLIRKEALLAKNRLPALLALLVVVPAVFAGASLAFEDVIPRDTPVAVVPSDDDVTDEELEAVVGVLSVFADPRIEDGEGYERALRRESVYAVVEVPPDFSDEGGTFTAYVDGAVVPFDEPSKLMVSVLEGGLRTVGTEVTVERRLVGEKRSLSEYLLPVLLTILVLVLGLVYVPYDLSRERGAIERLRLETSLVSVVLTKVAFHAALLVVPVAVFQTLALRFGYAVSLFSPMALFYLVVTFLYAALVGSAVALTTRFSAYGRLMNLVLLFGVLILSNVIYPVGFFSSLRRDAARLFPTHYSVLAVRSHATKDVPATLFADRLALLLGFTFIALLALVVAARGYEG